jgi:hypothetical protein
MKSFRNLFRSKKDEKKNESICNNRKPEHNHLPSALKPRLFNDDMSKLLNPSAAYHGNIKPSTRRPLRSCPGDVASNSRRSRLFDSDDEDNDSPCKHEKRPRMKPNNISRSVYGNEKRNFQKVNFDCNQQTSEYGSGDHEHSPISNVLKYGYDTENYYQKYRKYKNQATQLFQQTKKLEAQLSDSNHKVKYLTQQVNNYKQFQPMRTYNYPQPQYHSYYPFFPSSTLPPPPLPPQVSFSTAPTLPIDGEFDEVKMFRRPDTSEFINSSLSSNSLSTFDYRNNKPNRINSQTLFGDRENLAPPHSSFNDYD